MDEVKPVGTKNLKLKSARAAKDLCQQELAELVGVSRQTINAISHIGDRCLEFIPVFTVIIIIAHDLHIHALIEFGVNGCTTVGVDRIHDIGQCIEYAAVLKVHIV